PSPDKSIADRAAVRRMRPGAPAFLFHRYHVYVAEEQDWFQSWIFTRPFVNNAEFADDRFIQKRIHQQIVGIEIFYKLQESGGINPVFIRCRWDLHDFRKPFHYFIIDGSERYRIDNHLF